MDKNYRYQHNKREKRHVHNTPEREENVDRLDSFLDMPCKEIEVTCPSMEERKKRRQEFETKTRTEFLKYLADDFDIEVFLFNLLLPLKEFGSFFFFFLIEF